MKNCRNYIAIIGLSLSILSCGVKPPQESEALLSILAETAASTKKLAGKINTASDKQLVKTFKTLEKRQRRLFPLLKRCDRNNSILPEYLETLSESQKTLERLFRNYETTDDQQFILESIAMDYDAKKRSINYYVSKDANAKIKVIINSNQEEGYFVFAKLSYEKDMNIKRFRFDSPTNNASQYFVPGYYLFWLEKDERVSDPELHLIVGNGTDTEKKLTLKDPKQ